jgi:hypothetical protein
MRPPNDESDEMRNLTGPTRSAAGGASGEQDDVARFLTELRALGEGPPPPRSSEVSALISGVQLLHRHRAYRVVVRTALVAAALVAGLVVAAAQDGLPQPAQRVVSNVVDNLTPFQIAPDRHGPPSAPPVTPAPTHHASPTPTRHVTAPPTSPGDGDASLGGGDDGTRPSRSRSGDDRPGGGDDARTARPSGSRTAPGSDDDGANRPSSSPPPPTDRTGDDDG